MMDVKEVTYTAIVSHLAVQNAAWGAGDALGFAHKVLPDVVFTNVVGLIPVGAEPFIAQHAHIFATIYKGSRLDQRLERITMATADVAIVDTLTAVTGYRHLPPGAEPVDGAFKTRLEQVLVYRDGSWWVQAFHNTPVNPDAERVAAPSAGCAS
jgi:uncharacterized protein (TIGR02246 family)